MVNSRWDRLERTNLHHFRFERFDDYNRFASASRNRGQCLLSDFGSFGRYTPLLLVHQCRFASGRAQSERFKRSH